MASIVNIKDVRGKTTSYTFTPTLTVGALRDMYAEKEGTIEGKALVFQGKELSDYAVTLASLGVKHETTLFLFQRFKGGVQTRAYEC